MVKKAASVPSAIAMALAPETVARSAVGKSSVAVARIGTAETALSMVIAASAPARPTTGWTGRSSPTW